MSVESRCTRRADSFFKKNLQLTVVNENKNKVNRHLHFRYDFGHRFWSAIFTRIEVLVFVWNVFDRWSLFFIWNHQTILRFLLKKSFWTFYKHINGTLELILSHKLCDSIFLNRDIQTALSEVIELQKISSPYK